MQEAFVGIDVAKDWLDVYHPDHGARRVGNTPKAVRAFAASSAKAELWIVFEASGGYDRLLREALEAAAVRFSPRQPNRLSIHGTNLTTVAGNPGVVHFGDFNAQNARTIQGHVYQFISLMNFMIADATSS